MHERQYKLLLGSSYNEKFFFYNNICRENLTHLMLNNFFSENLAVYEKIWTNTAEPGRPQMTWRMRVACWTPKATNTHS
jgi:hypothetical protein